MQTVDLNGHSLVFAFRKMIRFYTGAKVFFVSFKMVDFITKLVFLTVKTKCYNSVTCKPLCDYVKIRTGK